MTGISPYQRFKNNPWIPGPKDIFKFSIKSSGTLKMTLERPYCKEVDATGTKSKGHLILARQGMAFPQVPALRSSTAYHGRGWWVSGETQAGRRSLTGHPSLKS